MTTLSQLHAQLIAGDEHVGDGEQLAEITVGDVLHITYTGGRPIKTASGEAVSPGRAGSARVARACRRLAALDALTDYLASTIVAWDLEADDGSGRILPAGSRDGLDDVDYRVQVVILQAIVASEQLPAGA